MGDQIPPQDPGARGRGVSAAQVAGSPQTLSDWRYTAIGIEKDHVYVHMVISPKYRVSFAVETIKKNTSRKLREKLRFLDKVYWDRGGGRGPVWGRAVRTDLNR